MAFAVQRQFMARFRLPDGEHIIAGHASSADVARAAFARTCQQNPEAEFLADTVVPTDTAGIEAAVAALREQDPSRPLATDLGLDTAQRVLTNPEVVPGSKVMRFDPPAAAE